MKTFFIESRVTKKEYLTIQAESRQEAIKAAEKANDRFWKSDGKDSERQLISIM